MQRRVGGQRLVELSVPRAQGLIVRHAIAYIETLFDDSPAGRASELTGAREQGIYLALAPYLGVTEAAKAIA